MTDDDFLDRISEAVGEIPLEMLGSAGISLDELSDEQIAAYRDSCAFWLAALDGLLCGMRMEQLTDGWNAVVPRRFTIHRVEDIERMARGTEH